MVAIAEDPAAALLDQGSGPALLLLHGWGASKELMAPIAERLPGYRIVAPDLPGFGATPPPPQAWGVDDYAEWVIALLDRLGIERAHIVGHSNGGRVAIAVGSAHPHRVDRLVLTDSAGIRPRHGLGHRWRVGTFKALRAASLRPWLPAPLRRLAQRRAELRGSEDYRAATGTVRASMVRLVNADLRPQLSRLAASTLLIWGARDQETPLSDARLMELLIPDAGLVVFDGCGHFAYAQEPDRFCRIVNVFLRRETS
ncbi:MAG TPA: alpha/beta fold hydrolase [Candidatus Dormibacteraeota bacterium]|jgi:pimeloyl-ACP methyl ester carboxylesterase